MTDTSGYMGFLLWLVSEDLDRQRPIEPMTAIFAVVVLLLAVMLVGVVLARRKRARLAAKAEEIRRREVVNFGYRHL